MSQTKSMFVADLKNLKICKDVKSGLPNSKLKLWKIFRKINQHEGQSQIRCETWLWKCILSPSQSRPKIHAVPLAVNPQSRSELELQGPDTRCLGSLTPTPAG